MLVFNTAQGSQSMVKVNLSGIENLLGMTSLEHSLTIVSVVLFMGIGYNNFHASFHASFIEETVDFFGGKGNNLFCIMLVILKDLY